MPTGIWITRKGFAAMKETGNLSIRLQIILEGYGPARRPSKEESNGYKGKADTKPLITFGED